ncbi:hypothetical protein DFH06DRAFT_1298493, partial [Mycena polygramma]
MRFYAFPKPGGQKLLPHVPSRQEVFISCGGYAAYFPALFETARVQLRLKRTRKPSTVPTSPFLEIQPAHFSLVPADFGNHLSSIILPHPLLRLESTPITRRSKIVHIHQNSANCKFNMVRMRTAQIFRHDFDPFPRINRTICIQSVFTQLEFSNNQDNTFPFLLTWLSCCVGFVANEVWVVNQSWFNVWLTF